MENYCNQIWPLIYDDHNQGRHQDELAFYSKECSTYSGHVLEIACGTGMILLPLLKQGVDIYGFDISDQMLQQLFAKAESESIPGVHSRISRQNMIDFQIDLKFDLIFIPARSFLHLQSQDDQLACLRNIHRHLSDSGRFILNFFTPNLPLLLTCTDPNPDYKHFDRYHHPDGKRMIDLSNRRTIDLTEQVQHITWRFEIGEKFYESPMTVNWIYKKEFELLAKFSGFTISNLYSGFDKSSYNGDGEMVWELKKACPSQ
ncbi:MAG: class I SAM-dependent methyltransferase [Proteobacteria bacterium]|nr:class I SAM-dependent methyltransferase [Pseudomonadota bacterium]MBU1585488.1 class I SAM-dependent methyltransferase [Pseudomonadota bacterium]MBU2452237.1 class I SAM-dependent methyltransferase [Pseudomonadota bacterium]MBU2628282.1 class I SAM-dependent methyltransferase [Pseudomonadota bacterium]